MSKDEARKLLGGYATGSLTEAERASPFQAALEDQDLFDELADEQALKEVLDEPGARQRLIAALEPPRHRAWLWVTGAATVAIAVVIGIVVSNRTPQHPQQIAQVMKSPGPAAPMAAPAVPAPAPVKRKAVPPPVAEPQEKLEARDAAPAPLAMRAQAESLKVSAGFALTYEVRADGSLQITPAETGFLSVIASGVPVFPSTVVNAAAPVRIAIPSDTTSLLIAFSRAQGPTATPVRRDGSVGTVTDQDPPNGKILIQLFLTPATR